MNIGLLLPSALMYEQKSGHKIFAPKLLFLQLANGLVQKGHTVTVYSSADTKTRGRLVPGDSKLALEEPPQMKIAYVSKDAKQMYRTRDARWEYEIDLTTRAYQDALVQKIDIMHSFLDFVAHYAASLAPVPTVYTIHDPVPRPDTLDEWRLRRFPKDHYVAISRVQQSLLSPLIQAGWVVYNGVSPEDYPFVKDPADYCFFMGRYMPEKGVVDGIDASIKAGVHLRLATSKEYKEVKYYKEQILPRLSNPLVMESGYMKFEQKTKELGKAKALLFPIKWEEPFGMVMIEAMACGTPVIAYNRGSVSEVVRDGITGFIIDPDNEDRPGYGSWVIKKQGVAGLIEAIQRIGEIDRAMCRRHVEDHFTVDKMVEGYEKVYEKVLHPK